MAEWETIPKTKQDENWETIPKVKPREAWETIHKTKLSEFNPMESGALEDPGFLGTITNPVEIAQMALTGGISALRTGKPVAKEVLDWASQGVIPLIRGGVQGAKNLIGGLSAKEIEKRIPPALTTPIQVESGKIVNPALSSSISKEVANPTPSPIVSDRPLVLHPDDKELFTSLQPLKPKPTSSVTQATSNSISKETFDYLKTNESGPPASEIIKSKLTKPFSTAAEQLSRPFGSPYSEFNLGKYPQGLEMWRTLDRANRAKSVWRSEVVGDIKKNIKIAPGSVASDNVGALLDKYESYEHIPSYVQAQMTNEEKQAFKYMRDKYDEWGKLLVDKKLMDPTKKIRSYFPRIFDKETIYSAWKEELDDTMRKMVVSGLDMKETALLKDRVAKLRSSIDTYEKTGTILYDYVPQKINAFFLKPRTGGTGYSFDSVRAFTVYEQLLSRKLFDEPAIQQASGLLKQIPEYDLRNYGRGIIRGYLGMDQQWAKLNKAVRAFTSLEYLRTMGMNARSAITNATQNLNTVIEIGPLHTARGAYRAMFDPAADAIWKASGHASEVPGLYYGTTAKTMEKVNEAAFYLFNKMELANRKTAYLGGYYKALGEGKLPQEAAIFADDVVRNTQFIYGELGMPRAIKMPGGPAAMQFASFSIKQTELLVNWIRHNPSKFLGYMVVAGGAQYGLKHLGIDISNAIGIGVDENELFQSLVHLSKNEKDASVIHLKLGLPKIPVLNPKGRSGAGILPGSFAPAVDTIHKILQGEFDKALPVSAKRLYESIAATQEGENTTESKDQGYPIRDLEGGLQVKESLPQLVGRQFIKPYKESTSQIEMQRNRLIGDLASEKKREAIKLAGKGDYSKIDELGAKYGIEVSKEDLRSEYLRRNLTPLERANMEKWLIKTKQSLGENLP
jgi:hypothetical protein